MNNITITLGEELFSFGSFQDWVNKAQSRYSNYRKDSYISIDAKERICRIGKDMMRARDDGAFPVRVYAIE